jgi:hypothetical protein
MIGNLELGTKEVYIYMSKLSSVNSYKENYLYYNVFQIKIRIFI